MSEQDIYEGFSILFKNMKLDLDGSNLQINQWHDKNSQIDENLSENWESLDCENGRILTATGVYTCPFFSK